MKSYLSGCPVSLCCVENNPVMYELVMELPWRAERFTKEEWLKEYVKARYGADDPVVQAAWTKLANSIYNSPKNLTQHTRIRILCTSGGRCVPGVQLVGNERLLPSARCD